MAQPVATVQVTVSPEQTLTALEDIRTAVASLRRQFEPTPGFQTSEGKLTALRQAAYAVLAVLGLFGVHAGKAGASADKWLPLVAVAAAVVEGVIYTARRSGLKVALAQALGALLAPVPSVLPATTVVPVDVGTPVADIGSEDASGAADPPRKATRRRTTARRSSR